MRAPSLLLLLALYVLPGCSGSAADAMPPIRIDGSSTVDPITAAAAAEFLRGSPGVRIEQVFSGTTAGFEKFCRGALDIQNASRPIRASELQACATSKVAFLELPIAYDGVTVIVHPSNTWATALTVDELRAIWKPHGARPVMRWSQVRPGFPDVELHLVGPGGQSGTFDFFTEAIVGRPRESRADYRASEDDAVIVDTVALDPLALGYVGFDHFQKHRDRLRGVAIDDLDDSLGVGPVEPSALNVRRGVYRPLSRPLFVYVNVNSLERSDVEKFVTRYLRQADAFATAAGAIPLRDAEYQLVRSRLQKKTTGSAFMRAGASGANVEKVLGE